VVEADDVIAFAEQVLALLDEGRFSATYKYALLLALIDVCLEHTGVHGEPPESVTTEQVAERVLALYWPHALPFAGSTGAVVLRQNNTRQAKILSAIERYRSDKGMAATLGELRATDADGFARLLRTVEWTLVEMPLPRLQTIGDARVEFLYRIGWDETVTEAEFRRSSFDRRVTFLPNAADHLVRLSALVRPLAQRHWAAMVARFNRSFVEDSHLEEFLFGASRLATTRIRLALSELQDGRCFYTGERLSEPEVDHFLPWARYPTDAVDNFVVCNRQVNNAKRAFLAAPQHVERWAKRLDRSAAERAELARIAGVAHMEFRPSETVSVARALYLRLPTSTRLWVRPLHFEPADHAALAQALDVVT
jgi:hypothetical protein